MWTFWASLYCDMVCRCVCLFSRAKSGGATRAKLVDAVSQDLHVQTHHMCFVNASGSTVAIFFSQNVSEPWLISILLTLWRPNASELPMRLTWVNWRQLSSLLTFIHFRYHTAQTQAIDQGSSGNLFKMRKEPRQRRSSPAKHFPGSMSRLHIRHCSTWGKGARRKSGRGEKREGGGFKIGFAEGSSWNIHHSRLFFWDPSAVSGGAGVGE